VSENGIVRIQILHPFYRRQIRSVWELCAEQAKQCGNIMEMERSMTCTVWIYRARSRESEVTSAGRRRGIKHRSVENF